MATVEVQTTRRLKFEKVMSRDQTRPTLTRAHVFTRKQGRGKTAEIVGVLEGTDSYRVVRLPVNVALDEAKFAPESGQLSADAIKAIEANGNVFTFVDGGIKVAGTTYEYEKEVGPYPKFDQILPHPDNTCSFVVGLNAKFLAEIAEALGEEQVALRFTAKKDGTPDDLRPMYVIPLSTSSKGFHEQGPVGLLMPVRVSGEAPVQP